MLCFRSAMSCEGICGEICAKARETSRMSGTDNGNGPQASTALQPFVVTYLTRTYRSVRDASVHHPSGAFIRGLASRR